MPRARKRGRPIEKACRRLLKSALSKNELLPGVFGLCFAGFLKNFQFRFCGGPREKPQEEFLAMKVAEFAERRLREARESQELHFHREEQVIFEDS